MIKNKRVSREKIVDSARRIVVSKGVEKLTVREIAKELRITDGALYRHFKSKKEIIGLLIDDIETTLLSTVEEAAAKTEEPLKQLENIFFSHLSYAEQRKGISFIVINQTLGIKDKSLQIKMFSVVNKYLKLIKKVLRNGIAQKRLRGIDNLDSAAVVFLGMIQFIVTIWGLSGYRYALRKDRLRGMFNIYKTGIESNTK